METIYLDYNATTPLDGSVRAAMLPLLDNIYGNPSSVHQVGRRARVVLDEARERAAGVLRCAPGEITFTSGGTESNNLAVLGTARRQRDRARHLVTSPVEHHAVLHCFQWLAQHEGFTLSLLPVDAEGLVHPDALRQCLQARPDTALVSVMAANNETGAIQPVAELGRICREHGVPFHTDAVQWFGKEPFSAIGQFEADLVSLCAHKFHGPKGAGMLFSRSPLARLRSCSAGRTSMDDVRNRESRGHLGTGGGPGTLCLEPVFDPCRLRPLTDRSSPRFARWMALCTGAPPSARWPIRCLHRKRDRQPACSPTSILPAFAPRAVPPARPDSSALPCP